MLPALALKFIKSKLQLVYLFPFAVTLTAFIISMLCTLAGQNAGVLEDLAVIRVNTSHIGYFLLSSSDNSTSEDSDSSDSWLDALEDTADDLADSIKNELKELANDALSSIAGELGIAEWYSLHLTSVCQGNFTDPDEPGSSTKTTGCSASSIGYKFNITEELSSQLSIGSLNLTLSDLGLSSSFTHGLTRQVKHLTNFLTFVTILLLVSTATAFPVMILSLGLVFPLGADRTVTVLKFSSILSGISFVTGFLGTSVVAIAATQIAQTLADFGEGIGLSASAGGLWLRLMTSVVVMEGAAFSVLFVKWRTPQIKSAAGRVKERVKGGFKKGEKNAEDV